MKVLLMPPIGGGYASYDCPHLGLGYLSSSLRKHGHEVQLLVKGLRNISREWSLPLFASQLEQSYSNFISNPRGVPGLIYRSEKEIEKNPCKYEVDLDRLGYPSWELIPPNEFYQGTVDALCKGSPVAAMIFTRGCPFQCIFCSQVNGQKVRKRSPAHILAELKMLYHEYGVREFQFIDSNVAFDKQLLYPFTE